MADVKKCWVTAPDNLFGSLGATARSCLGMREAIDHMGGCAPEIMWDNAHDKRFTIVGCHGELEDPISFCPWCGGHLTLETEETNG